MRVNEELARSLVVREGGGGVQSFSDCGEADCPGPHAEAERGSTRTILIENNNDREKSIRKEKRVLREREREKENLHSVISQFYFLHRSRR